MLLSSPSALERTSNCAWSDAAAKSFDMSDEPDESSEVLASVMVNRPLSGDAGLETMASTSDSSRTLVVGFSMTSRKTPSQKVMYSCS